MSQTLQQEEHGVQTVEELHQDLEVITQAEALECRDRLERAVRDLVSNVAVGYYDIMTELATAYDKQYYRIWGYPTIEAYGQEILGLKRRKTYDWLNCGRLIKEHGITRDQVARIGWTKLSVVARPLLDLDADRLHELLDAAEGKTVVELRDEVKMTKNVEAKPGMFRASFSLDGPAATVVSDAVQLAMNALDLDQVQTPKNMGLAINHICAEWMLLQGKTSEETTLDDWIEYLEGLFGVKLTRAHVGDIALEAALSGDSLKAVEMDDIDEFLGESSKTDGNVFADDDLDALLRS